MNRAACAKHRRQYWADTCYSNEVLQKTLEVIAKTYPEDAHMLLPNSKQGGFFGTSDHTTKAGMLSTITDYLQNDQRLWPVHTGKLRLKRKLEQAGVLRKMRNELVQSKYERVFMHMIILPDDFTGATIPPKTGVGRNDRDFLMNAYFNKE